MRLIMWAAIGAAMGFGLAGFVVLGGSTGASAQMMGYGYPAKGYYYGPAKPAPRALRSNVRPGSCGQFRYWDGGRCIDARTTPPKLK